MKHLGFSQKNQHGNLFETRYLTFILHSNCLQKDEARMTEKDKHHIEELKEMIQEKKPQEPVEKVLTNFCSRHAVSMDTCKKYYEQIVAKDKPKEK
jgi:hypothetical protein